MYLENFIQRDIIIKPFIINKTSNISYDRKINANFADMKRFISDRELRKQQM